MIALYWLGSVLKIISLGTLKCICYAKWSTIVYKILSTATKKATNCTLYNSSSDKTVTFDINEF